MVTVIGIDFSIQYPAVCISRDFKSFSWIACVNTTIAKSYQKFLNDIEIEYSNLRFLFLESRDHLRESYSAIERSKLSNYSRLADELTERIINEVGADDRLVVALEGLSYGAKGNALLDICLATGMIRKTILDRVLKGHKEKFFIFSPGELKNAIGAKGNAGKIDVYRAFINDPSIAIDSDLHRVLMDHENVLVKEKEIKSPFMDMIDAYSAILKIHGVLKESQTNGKG